MNRTAVPGSQAAGLETEIYAREQPANDGGVLNAARQIPRYIWLSVLGVTSAMIGVHWDISWHRSIGRDTFWTLPQIAIQLCGVIAGITCSYLILTITFTSSVLRSASGTCLDSAVRWGRLSARGADSS